VRGQPLAGLVGAGSDGRNDGQRAALADAHDRLRRLVVEHLDADLRSLRREVLLAPRADAQVVPVQELRGRLRVGVRLAGTDRGGRPERDDETGHEGGEPGRDTLPHDNLACSVVRRSAGTLSSATTSE
jgi:hypothetical protein